MSGNDFLDIRESNLAETIGDLQVIIDALHVEREVLHSILAHPQARDLLEHHRHLESDGCSCQATYDYGPADMTRGQWVAHVIDDARTRGMI